jgi:fructose-1,6-bisphosphatase I
MNEKRISLTRYLVEHQREHSHIQPQLRLLIEVVARACKHIAISVNKGALGEVLGSADTENVQGEVQKKLDVIANEVLIEANEWGGHLAAMASEEMDSIHVVPTATLRVSTCCCSTRWTARPTSTSTCRSAPSSRCCARCNHRGVSEEDFLQPGKQQAAAGYCVYGPQTTLVLTWATAWPMFTLDRETGSWVLTDRPDVQIPADTREFAINMSNMRHWARPVRVTSTSAWPARKALAARTSTCAGWPRWWPTCTAS